MSTTKLQSRILGIGKHAVKRLLGRTGLHGNVKPLYATQDYLEAYAQHTDLRVQEDPQEAVGGYWEEIGQLQFDFLKSQGLKSSHTMLDVGCGTLRGGRHMIRFLDPSSYHGLDISPNALAFARQLVEQEGLTAKYPLLLLSENKDLKFTQFKDKRFDIILAQSVFTHLMPDHIRECFAHVGGIMHEESAFYFTYFKARKYRRSGLKGFRYPLSFFKDLALEHGFQLRECAENYPHPRGQIMVEVTKCASSSRQAD